jgi:MFS family permease
MLSQVAGVALSFYTIYAVRHYGMSEQTAGVMTGILLLSQTFANPALGLLGDRWSHRIMLGASALMAAAGALLAIAAPELNWFYLVFALAGVAQAGLWTTSMALTAEFGTAANRPFYIGLANTLIVPATILAPIIGGWLADSVGFEATFMLAALGGIGTMLVLFFAVREPRTIVTTVEAVVDIAPASLNS